MLLNVRLRLSLMMFLQYFLFGSWFVTLGTYMSKGLHFDSVIGTAYGTQGIAAIISTLIVGAVADRFMAAQKLMGILALLSGLSLFLLTRIVASPRLFLCGVTLHFLFFVPTIALSNSIALHAITDRARQFPTIRVCGTAGWIAAGVMIGAMQGAAATDLPLRIGGLAGLALGLYSFTLPDTPPSAAGTRSSWRDLLGLDMFARLRDRNFAVFMAGVLIVLIPLGFYNTYCNNFLVEVNAHLQVLGRRFEPAALQALGQAAEFVLLLLLPAFLRRFGVKGVLVIGMLAWSLRYGLFAFGFDVNGPHMLMLVIGVMLHGVCYDFFFVAGQIYVDGKFEASVRVRAQAFLVTINMGLGVILASNFANAVYDANTRSVADHNWLAIWLIPAAIALVGGLVFALFFRMHGEDVAGGDAAGEGASFAG